MDDKKQKKPVQEPLKKPIKHSGKVKIKFRESRKFDLHIGREMIVFKGREEKEVPASWIEHKDFKNVSKNFIVKGA